ncbi:hypothetical protein D3C80_1881480 [compost metagenome]
MRSKNFCSFVFSTASKMDGDLIIKSEGFDDYTLKIRSFAKKEYSQNLDLKYAE